MQTAFRCFVLKLNSILLSVGCHDVISIMGEMDERMDGWKDGWMDGGTRIQHAFQFSYHFHSLRYPGAFPSSLSFCLSFPLSIHLCAITEQLLINSPSPPSFYPLSTIYPLFLHIFCPCLCHVSCLHVCSMHMNYSPFAVISSSFISLFYPHKLQPQCCYKKGKKI